MNLSDDPACDEIVELVTEFLEGAMPAEDAARFERHLRICTACVEYVEQMRATVRLTGRAAPEPLAPETRAAFTALLRRWKSGR